MLKGECTRFLTWTDTYASLESWALTSSSSKASPCLSTRSVIALRSSVRQPSRRLAGPVTENRCAVGIYASEHLLEWARGMSKAATKGATKAKVISWRSSRRAASLLCQLG